MKTWFDIKAKAGDDKHDAEVSIYDEVGGWGISAKDFIRKVKDTKAKRPLVRINSPGGSVFDGFAIFNFLSGLETTVQIDGVAASIASIIALAGKEVRIAENGFVMVHNPSGNVSGDAESLRDYAELLEKIEGTLANAYARKTGKTVEEVKEWMKDETWFTAAEAKTAGLVDTVTGEVAFSASLRSFSNVPNALKAVSKTAPQEARRAFDMGIKQVEDGLGGDGLEPATVKEARSLKSGEAPTDAKIQKAYRWWARNERFLEAEADSPADVAANLWGGAAGRDWFRALYAKLDKDEESEEDTQQTKAKTMNKLTEALVTAGLIASADLDDNAAAAQFVTNLKAITDERDSLKAKLKASDDAAKAKAKETAVALVDAAVADGRIVAEHKDAWIAKLSEDAGNATLLASIAKPRATAATPMTASTDTASASAGKKTLTEQCIEARKAAEAGR